MDEEYSWRSADVLQQELSSSKFTITDSGLFQSKSKIESMAPLSVEERVWSVDSTLESLPFPKPEKLVINPFGHDSNGRVQPACDVLAPSWPVEKVEKQVPLGSRTVTIQRDSNGFGFVMVDQKVRNGYFLLIKKYYYFLKIFIKKKKKKKKKNLSG